MERFKFTHGGFEYEVTGNFGNSANDIFVITKVVQGGHGEMAAVPIESIPNALSVLDLQTKIGLGFPGYTNFRSY